MDKRSIEIMVGGFVALGLLALFYLALQVSNFHVYASGDSYQLLARFDNTGGLKVRAPVTLAGVRIGRVADIGVDPKTYEAVVTLLIESRYGQIPEDTFAKIYTAGLLGEQYIGLDPGGSDKMLHDGGTIRMTQSALVLEEIVSQFLFKKAEEAAHGGEGVF